MPIIGAEDCLFDALTRSLKVTPMSRSIFDYSNLLTPDQEFFNKNDHDDDKCTSDTRYSEAKYDMES